MEQWYVRVGTDVILSEYHNQPTRSSGGVKACPWEEERKRSAAALREAFASLPSLSGLRVMEHAANVHDRRHFEWSDLGGWVRLWRNTSRQTTTATTFGAVGHPRCTGNIVFCADPENWWRWWGWTTSSWCGPTGVHWWYRVGGRRRYGNSLPNWKTTAEARVDRVEMEEQQAPLHCFKAYDVRGAYRMK